MDRPTLVLALAVAVTLFASQASAAEWTVAAAADLHAPGVSGHGIVLVDATAKARDNATWHAQLNTDTLRGGLRNVRLGPKTWLNLEVGGQAFVGGLLTDYYEQGESIAERGFFASWAGGALGLEQRLGRRHFVATRWAPRRWFFQKSGATQGSIPASFSVMEQSLSYTYWGFDPDSSHSNPASWRMRFRGFGFGAQFESHLRSRAVSWGQDSRNRSPRGVFFTQQWAAIGIPIVQGLRLQLQQETRWGANEDDITRRRIGGMTPYAISLAGAPWPAFLASRVAAAHTSLHATLFGDSEGGIQLDVVTLQDPQRRGSREWGVVSGGSLFADFRLDAWRIDLRVGSVLPTVWLPEWGAGAFIGLGRTL